MRGLLLAIAAACLFGGFRVSQVQAEEPLLLRIRPNGAVLPGSAEAPSDEEMAARARTRREAVWARSEARARIAIASVCTGCMKPMPTRAVMPAQERGTTVAASRSDAGDAAVPPATVLATAGEP